MMFRTRLLAVLAAALVAGPVLASSAQAQSRRPGDVTPVADEGKLSIAAGIGFIAVDNFDESFLMDFELDFRLVEGLSVGGQLQLGIEDFYTLISPAGYLRYTFDLGQMGAAEMARVRPYVQGGAGFTWVELDLPPIFAGVDDDDAAFLINFGFGADVVLTDHFAVGSKMLFNFMPGDVFNESFYYSWEVIGARFRF